MAKTWKAEIMEFGESGRLASSIKSAEKSWCAGVFITAVMFDMLSVGSGVNTSVMLGVRTAFQWVWQNLASRHFCSNVKLKNCHSCAEENTNVRIFITAMEKAAWPGLNIGGFLCGIPYVIYWQDAFPCLDALSLGMFVALIHVIAITYFPPPQSLIFVHCSL